ncbi:hypothetical protein HK405_015618, partial [Cladochytrium tenue]
MAKKKKNGQGSSSNNNSSNSAVPPASAGAPGPFPQVDYAGFEPQASGWKLDRVDGRSIDPAAFFARYVATRTPCIVFGGLPPPASSPSATADSLPLSPSWSNWASPEYLAARAGDAKVEIESRDPTRGERFGSARSRRRMRFAEFLRRVADGRDASLYLSTQYGTAVAVDEEDESSLGGEDDSDEDDGGLDGDGDVDDGDSDSDLDMDVDAEDFRDDYEEDEDEGGGGNVKDDVEDGDEEKKEYGGIKDLLQRYEEYCKPPLQLLLGDFPLRPSLLGSLVPQQVNLWIGAATSEGVSSGLHHDYADNLYVMIRGRKRFTLFPPSDA